MKALMILGSIIGFLIGTGFGLAAGTSWSTSLWRACAAALVAGILVRWWGRIWLTNLRDSIQHRRTFRPGQTLDNKPAAKL